MTKKDMKKFTRSMDNPNKNRKNFLNELMRNPIKIDNFAPLSREEIHERKPAVKKGAVKSPKVKSLNGKRKKNEFVLEKTYRIIKEFEEKYKMTSDEFLKRFQEGDLEENSDFFEWWAELKIIRELEEEFLSI